MKNISCHQPVPGRNALFLTIAAAIAYEMKINTIYTGVCRRTTQAIPIAEPILLNLSKPPLILLWRLKLNQSPINVLPNPKRLKLWMI